MVGYRRNDDGDEQGIMWQKADKWKVIVAGVGIVIAAGAGVQQLTVDVLALVKGAEATEVRIDRLEEEGKEMRDLLYSTREQIVSLRATQEELIRTLRNVNQTLKEMDNGDR